VFCAQEEAKKAFSAPVSRVKGRVREMKGTFSGGTAASSARFSRRRAKDLSLVTLLRDPFVLTPDLTGRNSRWATGRVRPGPANVDRPFVMANINTRNVHRSNMLMGFPYGKDFVYDEMMVTGPGEAGEAMAKKVMAANNKLSGADVPKPGEGPSKEERENGSYDLLFVAITPDGRQARAWCAEIAIPAMDRPQNDFAMRDLPVARHAGTFQRESGRPARQWVTS